MVRVRVFALAVVGAAISSCATVSDDQGTLAELQAVEADVEDVYLEDGIERAAQSYRRYLEEEIAETISEDESIDDEIHYLNRVFAS